MRPTVDRAAAMRDANVLVQAGAQRLLALGEAGDVTAIRAYLQSSDFRGHMEAVDFLRNESARVLAAVSRRDPLYPKAHSAFRRQTAAYESMMQAVSRLIELAK